MKGARTGQRIGTRGIRSLHSSCEATSREGTIVFHRDFFLVCLGETNGNEDAAQVSSAQCSASLPLPTRTSSHKPSPSRIPPKMSKKNRKAARKSPERGAVGVSTCHSDAI